MKANLVQIMDKIIEEQRAISLKECGEINYPYICGLLEVRLATLIMDIAVGGDSRKERIAECKQIVKGML